MNIKSFLKKPNHSVSAKEWNQIRKSTDYPNFQAVKNEIRYLESSLARSFAEMNFGGVNFNKSKIRRFEEDFEWFLTWRVKLSRFPHLIWCDGVEIIELKHCDKLTYSVEAKIWLGPESDTNLEFLCEMHGSITLSEKFDELENYQFEIKYEKQKFIICKAI